MPYHPTCTKNGKVISYANSLIIQKIGKSKMGKVIPVYRTLSYICEKFNRDQKKKNIIIQYLTITYKQVKYKNIFLNER